MNTDQTSIPSDVSKLKSALSVAEALANALADNCLKTGTSLPEAVARDLQVELQELEVKLQQIKTQKLFPHFDHRKS